MTHGKAKRIRWHGDPIAHAFEGWGSRRLALCGALNPGQQFERPDRPSPRCDRCLAIAEPQVEAGL